MARASQQTDQRLIQAALVLMPRTGVSGMKVRQVAARAGVNLGMFHYHFKSKREFTRRVLRAFYATFFERLTAAIAAAHGGTARDRLRAALLAFIRFAREHRGHMLAILRDVLDGNAEAIAFVRENFPRHITIVFRLLRDAQAAGLIRRLPLPVLVPVLAGPQVLPIVAVAGIERIAGERLLGLPFTALARLLLTDRAITARLDLALAAVSLPARRRA